MFLALDCAAARSGHLTSVSRVAQENDAVFRLCERREARERCAVTRHEDPSRRRWFHCAPAYGS